MKRVITIILAMAMALSICSVAYAENEITIKQDNRSFKEVDGTVNVSVSVTNNTPNNAYLRVIQPADNNADNAVLSASFTPDTDTHYVKIPTGETPVQFTVKVDSSTSETCRVMLLFNYYDGTDGKSQVASCQYDFTIERTSPTGGKLQTANSVHSENEIIRQAQQYISSHIREKLSVPLVARQVDVSPSYLTALFHKNLQISPGEYIRRIKLQESKQMIRENNLNFTEIAAALQYSTVHHFSRQFKEKFGITPTEYARSVR